MTFYFDQRLPDSAHIAATWRTRSEGGGSFTSRAASQLEMVVTKQAGKTTFTFIGPETKASPAPVPEDAEFFGILFKHGCYVPHLPVSQMVDGGIHLPDAGSKSVWLNGSAWQLPEFEDAETFVEQLLRDGVLEFDPIVKSAVQGEGVAVSERTVQRRFKQVTGISYATLRQIERARKATELLENGTPIADVVYRTGYADQPHLTRAMKLLAGATPAQILK